MLNTPNRVYFSSHLAGYKCWRELETALKRQNISYELLPYTADIWVRDFMPVQCANRRWVGYTYAPDYLRNQPQYITDWHKVLPPHRLPCNDAQLVLDGGNIIMCDDKVILTHKIFVENPTLTQAEVLQRVQEAFGAKPVIVPWDKTEPYGHADGMVRYLGNHRVLLTNYMDFDSSLREQLLLALRPHFDVCELHYHTTKPHKWNWAYINFLWVDNRLFVPRLNAEEDEQACAQLGEAFGIPRKHIELIDINTLLRLGGGLNCVSWTIYAPLSPLIKDEFSEAMHKEFVIDAETEIKHKLLCVKQCVHNSSRKDLAYWCKVYGISIEQVIG